MRVWSQPAVAGTFLLTAFLTTLSAGTALAQITEEAYLKAAAPDAGDLFGYAVAVSGDTMVVGAPFEDSAATGVNGDEADDSSADSGAAYVFVRDVASGAWVRQAYLKASNSSLNAQFGHAVAIDGDTLVVGAVSEGSLAINSGAAYVFVRDGNGVWTQQALFKAGRSDSGMAFGGNVAVSGDTVAVGAYSEDGWNGSIEVAGSSGAVYVYTREGDVWTPQAFLKAPTFEANDWFGRGLAIDGDTLVAGAFGDDSAATGVNGSQADNSALNAGAAHVFTRSGTVWTHQAYLKASDTAAGDAFGGRVSVSADTVVVTAYLKNVGAATDAGAAYVFVRDGTGSWSQQAFLQAVDASSNDLFGTAVSVSGDALVVGAIEWGSAGWPGAAYLFTRAGGVWSEIAKLGASNADADDTFGYSAAISAGTLVVGAIEEDGDAVNGPDNDGVSNAGAVYVFDVPVPNPGDTTPPVVTAPADILDFEATGLLSDVPLGNATATDDSGEMLTATALPNASFPLGDTEVTWSATDSSGNTGTDTQLVRVVDTTAPVVTAPGDITANLGDPVDLGTPSVLEAVDVETVANDWPGGIFPLGVTTVTWTAADTSGNAGSDTQLVTVVQAAAPLDLDITAFRATGRVKIGRGQAVSFTFKVKNESSNAVDFGSATLVGTLDGTVVHSQTLTGIGDAPGGSSSTWSFAPYVPDGTPAGVLTWVVTVTDGDPDLDVATATTRLVP